MHQRRERRSDHAADCRLGQAETGLTAPPHGARNGTVNLSGRISRKQGLAVCIRNLLPSHAADFGPDLECLAPGSSVLGRSDVIAAEMEQIVDLTMG
jgi:hypothetical protein